MTVVLDTSVLAAFLNRTDPLHDDAAAIMRRVTSGELGLPITLDHIVGEGLTLLRRRPGREAVSREFAALFWGTKGRRPLVQVRSATLDELRKATDLHFELYKKGLSIADCLLVGLARELGAPVASFDDGFDGLVPRVRAGHEGKAR